MGVGQMLRGGAESLGRLVARGAAGATRPFAGGTGRVAELHRTLKKAIRRSKPEWIGRMRKKTIPERMTEAVRKKLKTHFGMELDAKAVQQLIEEDPSVLGAFGSMSKYPITKGVIHGTGGASIAHTKAKQLMESLGLGAALPTLGLGAGVGSYELAKRSAFAYEMGKRAAIDLGATTAMPAFDPKKLKGGKLTTEALENIVATIIGDMRSKVDEMVGRAGTLGKKLTQLKRQRKLLLALGIPGALGGAGLAYWAGRRSRG